MSRRNRILTIRTIQLLYFTLLIFAVTIYVENNPQNLVSKASENAVHIEFSPAQITSTRGSSFTVTPIIVNQNQKKVVGYIELAIQFDRTHVMYSSMDDSRMDSHFTRLNKITPDGTNESGQLLFILGLANPASLPDRSIQLPTLTFQIHSEGKSAIKISKDTSQVVFLDEKTAELETTETIVDTSTPTLPSISPTVPTPTLAETPSTSLTPSATQVQSSVSTASRPTTESPAPPTGIK